ncbi:unnamed protein product [Urochloa humidicola]
MFAYRAVEREKAAAGVLAGTGRDRASDSSSEGKGNSLCRGATTTDDASSTVSGGTVRSRPESNDGKKTPVRKADARRQGPTETNKWVLAEGEASERCQTTDDRKENPGREA